MTQTIPSIRLISFATHDMTLSQGWLNTSFLENNRNLNGEIFSYNKENLNRDFVCFNKKIMSQERGYGYWLWKPFIIYDALLSKSAYGDYVLYSDAGIEVVSSIKPLIDLNEDIVLFENVWKHSDWCKGHVLHAMLPNGFMSDHKQLQASVILIKKTEKTLQFVRDWLAWCQVPGFIDDSPSELVFDMLNMNSVSNFPGFREHRHDQAILTNMALLHNIKPHWWPVDYNLGEKVNYPDDKYDIIFHHHRRRNAGTVGVCGNNKPLPTW